MIDKIKDEYNKNPNRTFTLFSFTPYIAFFLSAIFATFFTNESIATIFIIVGLCTYLYLRIWNMYMILKIKNRSLYWMVPGVIAFAWIGFIILISLNTFPENKMVGDYIKQKMNYNVNGICTLKGTPCEMAKDLGICNCEICKLNPNKEG